MPKIKFTVLRVITILIIGLCYLSCSHKQKEDIIPAGLLMAKSIHFQYAIYYLPVPLKDPSAALDQLLAKSYKTHKRVKELEETPKSLLIWAYMENDAQTEYKPPDMESLQYFGRGLTLKQAQDLQGCKQVFILNYGHPNEKVWQGLGAANEITQTLAQETGGLLWDEETREVFSPEEWRRRRITSWEEEIPDLSGHTTIHAYNTGEYVRAITLGMSKLGLPDVVIENFSWSMNRTMGHLINLFCQSIAEGAVVKKAGIFDLDLRTIKNKKVRDPQLESLKSNATAVALLTLKKGKWEEGDPLNRIIEITFHRYPGHDIHAKQEKLLSSLFGWEDSVAKINHNEELLAASRKARDQLPLLYETFKEGLQPGEFIQVKAPFATADGGREWMWVEITSWQGDSIKGLLKNEPFNIPSLHAGQIVEVKQEDVFDYIRRYPDGRQEGNETGEIILKIQQEKE
jgi:uncharacterized protein YegJ (DUF2314 family)